MASLAQRAKIRRGRPTPQEPSKNHSFFVWFTEIKPFCKFPCAYQSEERRVIADIIQTVYVETPHITRL